ncbi:MAG TPA: hypothetical protein VFG73_07460 [Rhodanobacteraceae bacterium]|nr:hypothetical protein [Rhodanobacteraceae bacterium]
MSLDQTGKNTTIVVSVSGGIVQDVVGTGPAQVILVDYDIDDEVVDVLPTVTARDGTKEKAAVSVLSVVDDPLYVLGIKQSLKV